MKVKRLYWYIFSLTLWSSFKTSFAEAECHYLLPYERGKTHRTLQGYFGKYSHKYPLEYAVDFEMKEGTPIHASRPGIVIETKFDSTESGKDKSFIGKANYIKIQHRDKTIGYYVHLQYQGVLVKKGERVIAGQKIGLSGCTGWCDGAHLHFEVYRKLRNNKRRTLPIHFITKQGVIKNMERQKSYTSILTNQNLCQ